MPRKDRKTLVDNNVLIEEEILRAYRAFTPGQLAVIAVAWCSGDYGVSAREAGPCKPIAVTVAALISVRHPLLCRNGEVVYSATACVVECMLVIIEERPIPIPAVEVINSPSGQVRTTEPLSTAAQRESRAGGNSA